MDRRITACGSVLLAWILAISPGLSQGVAAQPRPSPLKSPGRSARTPPPNPAPADDDPDDEPDGRGVGSPVPVPTLGGMQFWADELFFHQWRIQENVVSARCRLLDENNLRHAAGSYDECAAELERIKRERQLPPMRGKAVLLLHGLGDTRRIMSGLEQVLREKGGYQVFNVTYPSTQRGIPEHSQALGHIVRGLEGIEEIDFVGFSLGNIVIRHYLADATRRRDGKPDPRFGRLVMIGPPNHGAEAATALSRNLLFQAVAGQAGQELGPLWTWLEADLGAPPIPFGVIAGGRGKDAGYNPLLPGDNDGIVTVASARLAGAADFALLPQIHTFLPRDSRTHTLVLHFLHRGRFPPPEQPKP